MRGYVEAQEAAHKFGVKALNDVEVALVAPQTTFTCRCGETFSTKMGLYTHQTTNHK